MIHRILATLAIGMWAVRGLAAAPDPPKIDCRSLGTADGCRLELEEYWTLERMGAARPLPLPILEEEDESRSRGGERPGSAAEGISPELTESLPWPGRTTPVPADVAQWPYRTAGRLFFSKNPTKKGQDFWCTAEFVGTPGTVLTAAHCVRSGLSGKWYSKFRFVRGYGGESPQIVSLERVATWPSWVGGQVPDYSYDYAFFATADLSNAGWLALGTVDWYFFWRSIGYPKNYGDGKTMYRVTGPKGTVGRGTVEMLGNPMDRGASGGAWIGGGGSAIGLNSHYFRFYPDRVGSPRFDERTLILLANVVNGCR